MMMEPTLPAAFQAYLADPSADSALERAIACGIDPTLTFFNMYGLTREERLARAGARFLAQPRLRSGYPIGHRSEITNKRIRRGTFQSVRKLEKAIKNFVADHNAEAKPFVWTNSARTILRKIKKCHAIYGSEH